MDSEDIRDVVRRWTLEGIGQCRLKLAEELIHPDFIYHERGREDRVVGPQGQRQAILALHEAFADFRVSIEDMVVSGDRVAVRDRISGIHTAPFAGIPAQGRRLDLMRLVIYRVAGGMIRESWAATDVLALIKQLVGRS